MKRFLTFALSSILCFSLAACSSSSESSNNNEEGTKSEEKTTQKKSGIQKGKVGDTITTKLAKITVNSAESTDQFDDIYSTADKLKEGKVYEVIDITIENLSDEELNISSIMNFELKDDDGRKQDYELPVGADGQMDGEILPGDKLSGQLLYMANADGELILTVKDKIGGGETVQFQIR